MPIKSFSSIYVLILISTPYICTEIFTKLIYIYVYSQYQLRPFIGDFYKYRVSMYRFTFSVSFYVFGGGGGGGGRNTWTDAI